MMENQPPLTSPDGSRKTNTMYSGDSTQEHREIPQEHQEIPQDDQFKNVKDVKVEVKKEAEEPYVKSDEPYKDEEIPPEISPDSNANQRDIKTEEEEGRNMRIKKEELLPEISIAPGDVRATHAKVKEEEEEEERVRIKEEEIPIAISTNPGNTRETRRDIKTEAEEEGHTNTKRKAVLEIGMGRAACHREIISSNKRPSAMSLNEMVEMVRIFEKLDFDCRRAPYGKSIARKDEILEKVIAVLHKRFGHQRSKDQLRKRWSDLKEREMDQLAKIKYLISKNKQKKRRARSAASSAESTKGPDTQEETVVVVGKVEEAPEPMVLMESDVPEPHEVIPCEKEKKRRTRSPSAAQSTSAARDAPEEVLVVKEVNESMVVEEKSPETQEATTSGQEARPEMSTIRRVITEMRQYSKELEVIQERLHNIQRNRANTSDELERI